MWISSSWQCRQLPVLLLCDHACGGVESWVLTKVPEPRLALFKNLGHPGHRFSRLPSPEGLLSLQAVYQCPQDNSDAPVFQLGDQLPEICSPTFFFAWNPWVWSWIWYLRSKPSLSGILHESYRPHVGLLQGRYILPFSFKTYPAQHLLNMETSLLLLSTYPSCWPAKQGFFFQLGGFSRPALIRNWMQKIKNCSLLLKRHSVYLLEYNKRTCLFAILCRPSFSTEPVCQDEQGRCWGEDASEGLCGP